MEKRLNYIDIAKGIGIILVVLGHSLSSKSISGRWIWSFHMPLFFFISGFCFNSEKYLKNTSFAKTRIKQLIIPYIYFVILLILMETIIYTEVNFLSMFYKRLIVFIKTGELYALWFLPILFFTGYLYYLINKYQISAKLHIIILLLFAIFGFFLYKINLKLPYSLTTIFSATLFYGAGHLLRDTIVNVLNKIRYIWFWILLLLAVTIIFAIIINPATDMKENRINPFILSYFAAFIGISLIFLISFYISGQNKIHRISSLLMNCGKNTLAILSLHMFFLGLSAYYLRAKFENYLIYKVTEQAFIWFLLIISILLINNFFPWLVGKKKRSI